MSTRSHDFAASLTRLAPPVAVADDGAAPAASFLRLAGPGSCVRLSVPTSVQATLEGQIVAVHGETLTVRIDTRWSLFPPPDPTPPELSSSKRWLWMC